jgi:hypothetical protein
MPLKLDLTKFQKIKNNIKASPSNKTFQQNQLDPQPKKKSKELVD